MCEMEKLANFIMVEIEGEPSQSEGAGTCAIRIIKQLQAEIKRHKDAVLGCDKCGNPEIHQEWEGTKLCQICYEDLATEAKSIGEEMPDGGT